MSRNSKFEYANASLCLFLSLFGLFAHADESLIDQVLETRAAVRCEDLLHIPANEVQSAYGNPYRLKPFKSFADTVKELSPQLQIIKIVEAGKQRTERMLAIRAELLNLVKVANAELASLKNSTPFYRKFSSGYLGKSKDLADRISKADLAVYLMGVKLHVRGPIQAFLNDDEREALMEAAYPIVDSHLSPQKARLIWIGRESDSPRYREISDSYMTYIQELIKQPSNEIPIIWQVETGQEHYVATIRGRAPVPGPAEILFPILRQQAGYERVSRTHAIMEYGTVMLKVDPSVDTYSVTDIKNEQ